MDKQKHVEGHKLMWYACVCGHRERIWNSRDGVTPFGLGQCPSCGGSELSHINWQNDEPAPDHKPHKDQRYFEDGTIEDACAIIERRIKIFADAGQPIPDDVQKILRTDAKDGTGEWNTGWPIVRRAASP